MTGHPAITAGRAAVITGAAGGIGLAAACRLASLGLNIVLADNDAAKLGAAAPQVLAAARDGVEIETLALDVAKVEEHRGRDARPSRAYTYRSGYALPSPVPIAEIRSRIEHAKAARAASGVDSAAAPADSAPADGAPANGAPADSAPADSADIENTMLKGS